ncbi:ABC transporter ATP-binding protein [Halalkalibacter urbisdiaboli]|uniref:ABC transporter ATP-binding protein n=1 Tax=Halalkalibacter urbisdiaboli TaxID=1960589 RepID=UPI000B43AA52|nr:ABC transporter ATP-binding protein [Halalkalibacter urbisdiaboli]
MNAVISVNDVSWRREQKLILNKISWTVNNGEHWVVLGLNGSGKTSLLNMVMGYLWPTKGTITVLGETFGQTNIPEVRKKIGWVSSSMDERFLSRYADSALEVVMSGKHASVGLYESFTKEDTERAGMLLQQLKIERLAQECYIHLSQGEKRRVMIARALMASPQLLILDEPCNGLDIFAREQLLDTVQTLAEQPHGPTLIYVTHHIEEVVPAVSHALLINQGTIVKAGKKKSTLTNDFLSHTFQLPLQIDWEAERPWLQIKKDESR